MFSSVSNKSIMLIKPGIIRSLSAQAAPAAVSSSKKKNLVLVDGVRTPFTQSSTVFKELMLLFPTGTVFTLSLPLSLPQWSQQIYSRTKDIVLDYEKTLTPI